MYSGSSVLEILSAGICRVQVHDVKIMHVSIKAIFFIMVSLVVLFYVFDFGINEFVVLSDDSSVEH